MANKNMEKEEKEFWEKLKKTKLSPEKWGIVMDIYMKIKLRELLNKNG